MKPYKDWAEVVAALTSGTVQENTVVAYARNKNLSDERRSMFRVAVYQYRIVKLQQMIDQEQEKLAKQE